MSRIPVDIGTTSPSNDGPQHIRLACQACQRKKIKCDRTLPCGQCTKSSLVCVPSSRKQRTRHAGKRGVDGELRSRIAKLESLVESLGSDPNAAQDKPVSDVAMASPTRTSSIDVNSATIGRYVANNFWSSLTNEFAALREALEEEDEEDGTPETGDGQISSPGQSDLFGSLDHDIIVCPPGRIFIMPGVIVDPEPRVQAYLIDVFFQDVEPMVKIFHRPTLRAAVVENADYLGHPAGSIQHDAIKRLIWLAACNALSESDVLSLTGHSRLDTILKYRRFVGVTLSQLDLMNTGDLATLQCFLLFITVCRTTDHSRRTWTSLALLVRNAQAVYMNQDDLRATPFVRELRKRLWHYIRFFDKYCALDRGSGQLIRPEEFTIPFPTNTNDDLFDPSSATIPELPGTQITDMTFALMCFDACGSIEAMIIPEVAPTGPTWEERRQIAIDAGRELEAKYLSLCDLSIPFQRLQHAIGKTIVTAMVVRAVRPMQRHLSSVPPPVDSPEVLQMAVDNLKTSYAIFTDDSNERKRWLKWVPWHCLAVALAGLCNIRGTELAQKAWMLVEPAYQFSSRYVADGVDGMLWRPVAKLYKKAVAFRDAEPSVQNLKQQSITAARSSSGPTGMDANADMMPSWSPSWSTSKVAPVPSASGLGTLETNFSTLTPFAQSIPSNGLAISSSSILGATTLQPVDFSNTNFNDPSWTDWGHMMDEFNDPLAMGNGINMDLMMNDWTMNNNLT